MPRSLCGAVWHCQGRAQGGVGILLWPILCPHRQRGWALAGEGDKGPKWASRERGGRCGCAPVWGVWPLEMEEGASPSQVGEQLTTRGQWGEVSVGAGEAQLSQASSL